jgi:sortase A
MTPEKHNQHPMQSSSSTGGSLYVRAAQPITPERQQRAEQIARDQANHQYRHNPPNQLSNTTEPSAPYNQTHQPTYDWQQYHSAWQQYYQQYYQRYYTHQLLTQRAQDHRRQEPKPALPELGSQTITGSDTIKESKTRFQQVRDDLLGKVRDRTEKARRSSHFVPIVCAIIVILLFAALQFNRLFVAQIESYISPGSTVDISNTIIADPSSNTNVGNDPRLVIPKINVSVPVSYDVTTVDEKAIQKALERGVVHYGLPGANSVPGQAGNGVILGHSSNDVFDPGGYKFVFVLLNRLQNGDLFYINYQGTRYVYKVTAKKTIKPTDWQILQQSTEQPTMILVTCTPAGTANNRLLVYGQQISPDPSTASAAPPNAQDANPAEIPGNSQTFFERLYSIFF